MYTLNILTRIVRFIFRINWILLHSTAISIVHTTHSTFLVSSSFYNIFLILLFYLFSYMSKQRAAYICFTPVTHFHFVVVSVALLPLERYLRLGVTYVIVRKGDQWIKRDNRGVRCDDCRKILCTYCLDVRVYSMSANVCSFTLQLHRRAA